MNEFDAETSLLGSLLADNSLLANLPFLEAKHFSEPVNQRIFEAIQAAHSEGKVASVLTLKEQFDRDEALLEVGGMKYLVAVLGSGVHCFYPVETAEHLVLLSQKRALKLALTEALEELENEESSGDVALELVTRFEEISRGFDGPKFETDTEVTDKILKGMFTQFAPNPTGITKLDEAMDGGLYPGKAYGFAAKKKHGKTILAGTISGNLNAAGVRHLFICAEMSSAEVHQRQLARITNSKPSAFRSEYGKSVHFQSKVGNAAALSKGCILYHSAPGITFERLRRVVLSAILQKKVSGFILDYWQLVRGQGKGNLTEHYDLVAQWIADTCRKHNVWSITMAQINREGDTRGGDGIRLAFDQVYQIHRPDLGRPHTWLEMMDTRYTHWQNIGEEEIEGSGLMLNEHGPYFEEAA